MLFFLMSNAIQAEEGMWPPHLINNQREELQDRGLQFPVEWLETSTSPILQSIASFEGCSAALVSDNGLLLSKTQCL